MSSQFWVLSGNPSNVVVVLASDRNLFAGYPPAPWKAIEPRMKIWLGNERELGFLREIYAALPTSGSTAPKATSVPDEKTLRSAFLQAFQFGTLVVFETNFGFAVLEEVVVKSVRRCPINKLGFIDNSDGANIRTGPAESGGQKIRQDPLPPTTPVFVSGPHPDAPGWWHVTAYAKDGIYRGYVQGLRVNTNLPEPTARLYQIKKNDNVEKLARQEFSSAVRPGHDLAFYENVLLYVNQQKGKQGITGSYQKRTVFGGGGNNIKLIEGARIWLVSPAFAKALEEVVPSGSLTGGAFAELKEIAGAIQDAIERFAKALLDIVASITESPNHAREVFAEDWEVIREHLAEIITVVAGFIALEGLAAAMAGPASPLILQLSAAAIQLVLAMVGAQAALVSIEAAVKHGAEWLRIAIQANGRPGWIADASKAFLRMLKNIIMAWLSVRGVKANLGKAAKIMNSLPPPPPMLALAVANGGNRLVLAGNAGSGTAAALGPPVTTGSLGAAGALMAKGENSGGSSKSSAPTEFPRKSLRGVSVSWLKRNKPRGWRHVPTDKKGGWKWLDENGVERLRFMWKNGLNATSNKWCRQANGYFRWQNTKGQHLDIDGNVIDDTHPQFQALTHIPYEGVY